MTPFLVETMYQNLKAVLPPEDQAASVHFLMIPKFNKGSVCSLVLCAFVLASSVNL